MGINLQDGVGLLYMKVGVHAQETLEDIIRRKQREYDEAGMIFWGYGGSTCHPSKHVQPYARGMVRNNKNVYLVMQEINSNHFAEPKAAEEYSEDGLLWKPVPKGVEVRGSRYALVLENLEFENFNINLQDLNVAVGPSRGKLAADYIKGQNDKGCFELKPRHLPHEDSDIKPIRLYAQLKEPFAVHIR